MTDLPPQPPNNNPHNSGWNPPDSGTYWGIQQTNQLALWSMILGIAGFPLSCLWGFGLLAWIAALVTGYMARKQPMTPTDATRAKAGIIMGWIGVGLTLLGLIVGITLAIIGVSVDYGSMSGN